MMTTKVPRTKEVEQTQRTPQMLTDEMDEIIATAWRVFDTILESPTGFESYKACMRAALEAVAPALRAQGMSELAAACYHLSSNAPPLILKTDILAKIAELEKDTP
jgi:hypothetical protein